MLRHSIWLLMLAFVVGCGGDATTTTEDPADTTVVVHVRPLAEAFAIGGGNLSVNRPSFIRLRQIAW